MYRCTLVNKGIVRECFFRRGESAAAVLETLKMFRWPRGQWIIEEV